MLPVSRVLDPEPVADLAAYEAAGGGRALRTVLEGGGDAVLAVLEAAGLRGRGGAGFPTHRKWQSIIENTVPGTPPQVVVNAAEGEPGSYKDRAILLANPFRTLEGALVAAITIGAERLVIASKAGSAKVLDRLRSAIGEIAASPDWPDLPIEVVEGPAEYLYGEETALLEVVAGRAPFPRVAPPWRRGLDEPGGPSDQPLAIDEPADADAGTLSAPTLVNNVETLAHVANIVAEGPDWFREHGTDASPGTLVCTVSGDLEADGVVEVAMGTTLRQLFELVGGDPVPDLVAVMPGVSAPLLPASLLDTPLTYEDMEAVGSGLGAAAFVAIGAATDPVAVVQGASRFLAVESCGQCTPCKQDGLALSESLGALCDGTGDGSDIDDIGKRLLTVEDGARCYLATQQRQVVSSLVDLFPDRLAARAVAGVDPLDPYLVAEATELVDGPDGAALVLDETHRDKQPDWRYDAEDSGQAPADRIDQTAPG